MNFNYNFHRNHELVLNKEVYYKNGLSGIINTGNKCYSNSIIQCLSHTLKLTDYLLSNKLKNDTLESNLKKNDEYFIITSFVSLLRKLWERNELVIPTLFYEKLYKVLPKYNNNTQQDSHEFLLDILNLFNKTLSYKIHVDITGEVLNDTDKLTKDGLLYWKSVFENEYSQIIELFNGMTLNLVECANDNCKYESNSIFECFNTINLNINNQGYILDNCLDNYFSKSTIEDWKCEKCSNTGCTKSLNLWSLPNYLIIQFKRFDNNGNKINTLIDFPIDELNLTKYINPKKGDPNNYIYSLYAINYHSGNLRNGHYWSSVKNLDNEWYILNDGHVSKYNSNSDLKLQLITSDVYLLFYYRKMII
jgi:ubiquitin C-terminal hydrolase